jgi:hypothetical protein
LEEVGTTPAKLIERQRTEHARLLITTTGLEPSIFWRARMPISISTGAVHRSSP